MNSLDASTSESFTLPSGKVVAIPKAEVVFEPWRGEPIADTYGNKQVLNYEGHTVFAELAVLSMLKKDGWDGVWVDSYRKCFRVDMPGSPDGTRELPEEAAKFFNAITATTGFKGCWDVFAWKDGNEFLFAECKRKSKDEIRDTQLLWLETCLNHGLSEKNFLLVEWDVKGAK